jgi:hypothetical protein
MIIVKVSGFLSLAARHHAVFGGKAGRQRRTHGPDSVRTK